MSCSTVELSAKWGEGKTFSAKLQTSTKPRTTLDLPLLDYVRVDFRSAINAPILLRLTTEGSNEVIIDRAAKTITFAISRDQMMSLAPINVPTRVIFQVRWGDAAVDPDVVEHWPISQINIAPVNVLDVEPASV